MKEGRMIGLVRLEPLAACAWVITLESLPPPPALKYSAFMIRCGGRIPVDAVINWFNDLRTQRPDVPIGAVLRAGDASAFSVLRNGIQFTPLIAEHELVNGRVPPDVLETVWDHAIEGRILAVWRTRWNLDHPETEALAAAVAAVGIAGGGIKTLIRTLRCPETTLYRRFAGAHLPCPGELLRIARFESVDARIGLGMTEETAAAGAGWSDLRMYHQAKRRRDR
jgi:hypothetical protein